MRTTIATIALALLTMRVAVGAAEEPGRPSALAAPSPGLIAPTWTINFSQTAPPPSPPVPAGSVPRADTAEGEPLLALDEALTIALAGNRGVRTANLEVGRAEDRIGVAQARRLPGFRIGFGADYPLVPIDLDFRKGDFGTYP